MDKKELAKLARREYDKAWRNKNKERLKAYRESYWAKKGAVLTQQIAEEEREL